MPSKQVIDILDHIRSFHQRLSELYEDLGEHQSDERLIMLLKYLSRHEEGFSECLKEYEEDTTHDILNTWVQFHTDEEFDLEAKNVDLHEKMNIDEIIERALVYDRKLIGLYRELESATAIPRVQELFANLVQMEENKSRQYARTIQELES